jgi:RNA polymerase sigma factor (sigma-70 family)
MELDGSFDARLLDGCSEGDAEAWRKLHQRYYPVAAAFLRKLGVDDRDLDDAAQEVFLQVYKYLPRFRRQAELSTWVYRICISEARRVRRRTRVTEALLRVLSLAPGSSLISAPCFSEDAARRRIESALSELAEGERATFVLYEMEGVPGKQIAEILKVPESTVWRRLHYARQTFRRALGAPPLPPVSGLDELELDLDLELLRHQHAAGLERLVPAQPPVAAAERGLRAEANPIVAPGVFAATCLLDLEP